MPTCAIYARVSNPKQEQNYSVPTQLEGCRKYALEHGFTVVGEYVDIKPGSTLNRPQFDLLKAQVGFIDAAIFLVQDRFSRADELDTLNFIRERRSGGRNPHGTGSITVTGIPQFSIPIDPGNLSPTGNNWKNNTGSTNLIPIFFQVEFSGSTPNGRAFLHSDKGGDRRNDDRAGDSR